jgi:hypothetical protein
MVMVGCSDRGEGVILTIPTPLCVQRREVKQHKVFTIRRYEPEQLLYGQLQEDETNKRIGPIDFAIVLKERGP